jgi:hypothetical protein
MGPTTLVSRDQIEGGEDLLKFLPSRGVPITAAVWAQTEGDGQPYLYILSPEVDVAPSAAMRRFVDAFRELEPTWADPFRRLDAFAIKLFGPSEARGQTFLRDAAYVYPASLFTAPTAPTSPSA